MKNFYYLLAAALMGVSSVKAEEVIYTYAPEDGTRAAVGAGKYVDNDLAILVKNPGYVGYKITGISVNIPVVDGCECNPVAQAWVASELLVDPTTYNFDADIMTVSGEIKNVGTEENPSYRLDVTFPEPYVLTEEGVYVGYTISVTKLKSWTKKYPLETGISSNSAGGLFYHFDVSATSVNQPVTNNKVFVDGSADGMVSTMKVILHGDKASESAIIEPANVYGVIGDNVNVNATLSNFGSNAITNFGYEFACNGNDVQKGQITLGTPLPYGESVAVEIPFMVPQRGDYNYTLTLSTVNGVENVNVNKVSELAVYSRPWIPRKRVLIEEYTGCWCGNCPEAYVTIKQIHDKRPDDVIVLTFHSNDSMQTISSDKMPAPGAEAPRVRLDRTGHFKSYQFADNDIVDHLDVLAPAELSVDLYWSDDSHKALRAQANLRFVDPAEADRYRLTYALVEDNISGPDYNQRNFFLNPDEYTSDWYKTDYWDLFIGKGFEVSGIVYDDVALVFPDCHGIPESVPAVAADEKYSHFSILNLDQAVGIYGNGTGKSVIKDRNKLRAVAVLLDKETGKAVNAATSCYAANIPVYDDSLAGVDSVSSGNATDVVAEEYYNIEGMRLAERPEKGIVIVVYRHADGSATTAKIMQ